MLREVELCSAASEAQRRLVVSSGGALRRVEGAEPDSGGSLWVSYFGRPFSPRSLADASISPASFGGGGFRQRRSFHGEGWGRSLWLWRKIVMSFWNWITIRKFFNDIYFFICLFSIQNYMTYYFLHMILRHIPHEISYLRLSYMEYFTSLLFYASLVCFKSNIKQS